jgi:formate hydrogenlyase subunit 3/multisubunit Na+/H+ antiporter MnhD subunit
MVPLGKALVIIGLLVVLLGLLVWSGGATPVLGRLGHLPGDIRIRRDNFSFYFPITTCIVLSIAISLLIGLLRRW